MSRDIRIPKDLKEYEPKILFGMTWKQLLFTTLGVVLTLITYRALRDILPKASLQYIPWVTGLPFIMLGFFKLNGMPFDRFMKAIFTDSYLSPKRRIYKIENTILNDIKLENEKNTVAKKDKKSKKKDKTTEGEIKKKKYKKSKLAIK